jgi:hypothetical protein
MDINALLDQALSCNFWMTHQTKTQKEAETAIDNDFSDDTPVNACLTHCELLQAASVISSYVSTLDSTFACKMEAVLASFG